MKKLLLLIAVILSFTITPIYAEENVIIDRNSDNEVTEQEENSNTKKEDYIYINAVEPIAKMLFYFFIIAFVSIAEGKKLLGISIKSDTEEKIINQKREEYIGKEHTNFDDLIKKYLPDYTEEKLTDEFYNIFVSVHNALMDFDYKKLEDTCSNELYASYVVDLDNLKESNSKHIVSDFSCISSVIRNIEITDNRLIIDGYLYVEMKDYIVDKNGKVIDGSSEGKINNEYDLEYIIDILKDSDNICPNCGAKMNSRECEFCHTVVSNKKGHLVLNKIDIIENYSKK